MLLQVGPSIVTIVAWVFVLVTEVCFWFVVVIDPDSVILEVALTNHKLPLNCSVILHDTFLLLVALFAWVVVFAYVSE